MAPKKVVVDCDVGTDDAHALMMLLSAKEVDIVAICGVMGNTDIDNVMMNINHVLKVCNRTDIPVFRGCAFTLNGDDTKANDFHGVDGLGDVLERGPEYLQNVQPLHASREIVRLANKYSGELTLLALGPLTNVAVALHLDPRLGTKLKEFVSMGGNTTGDGNITRCAEFNVFCDAEAARTVLERMHPCLITLVPLELCRESWPSWDWLEKLRKEEHEKAKFLSKVNSIFLQNVRKRRAKRMPMYDQLAAAIVINECVVTDSRTLRAMVCTDGGICHGTMVYDWAKRFGERENIRLVTAVNNSTYDRLLWQGVATS